MYTLYNVKVYLSNKFFNYYVHILYVEMRYMKLRILDILKQKGKTKYWLYVQLGLSYQNFNNIVNNKTGSIKFSNLKALCDILECTPNDLFEEYYQNK